MARTLIVVALIVAAAAVVAAQPEDPKSPKGSWNLYGAGSVGRPLPGQHLKQTDKTVARLIGMFTAKGRVPQGGYDRNALQGAMQALFDSWGLTATGGPMADYNVKLGQVDVWPEGEEGSDKLGLMVGFSIWRKDGGDFTDEDIEAGKIAADTSAANQVDLTNAGFTGLNINDVYVKRRYDDEDQVYVSDFHMLEFLKSDSPIMAPGARVRANGGIEASRAVEPETIRHFLPRILAGCMSEYAMYSGMDFGVSPAWFKFIRVAAMPLGENGEDGVRTLFALNLDLPPFQGSAQIAQFLAYTLPECFDKQLFDAIPFIVGEQVDGKLFEPEVEAFLQPERFQRRDAGYFAVSFPSSIEASEKLFFEEDEKMYQAMAQAANAAIDWNIMNNGGNPMGPRMNASNFEIIGTGLADLGVGSGPQAHIIARVFGTDGVDFPEPTPMMFKNVMNPVVAHFFGPNARIVPFFGGGGENGFKAARITFTVGGMGTPLAEGWSEADSVIKGMVSMYAHTIAGSVAGANLYGDNPGDRLQIYAGWKSGFTLAPAPTAGGNPPPPKYTFNTIVLGPATVVDAALAQLDGNTDALESWIADYLIQARRLEAHRELLIGAPFPVEFFAEEWGENIGSPPGTNPGAITTTFRVMGTQVPNADVDAFKVAVEASIREVIATMSTGGTTPPLLPPNGGVDLIGCFWEGPMEPQPGQQPGSLKCQIETTVPETTRNIPGFMDAVLGMIDSAAPIASAAFQRNWGNGAMGGCDDCGTATAMKSSTQMFAELQLRYNELRIEQFAPFEANNGALRVLYTDSLVKALRSVDGLNDIVAGDLWIEFNGGGGGDRRRLEANHFARRLWHDSSTFRIRVPVDSAAQEAYLESDAAERMLQDKIDHYLKTNGGVMSFPEKPNAPPPPPCIAHVFKYDKGDGSPAQVATNNCYAAFPASSCNGAPEIDDGRGNKYKLMGSWASYNHLQTC